MGTGAFGGDQVGEPLDGRLPLRDAERRAGGQEGAHARRDDRQQKKNADEHAGPLGETLVTAVSVARGRDSIVG
ncbi:hypothetical protein [Streptomyces sp. DG1A-41]|uniref:hypothetical protein n=1 Tax=Streptomyces sp. DG1A-41 TaxID=3125779 RepID=UPI0030CF9EB0